MSENTESINNSMVGSTLVAVDHGIFVFKIKLDVGCELLALYPNRYPNRELTDTEASIYLKVDGHADEGKYIQKVIDACRNFKSEEIA